MKRSRHAVGECYKTLNIHDPHDEHVWAKEVPLWKVVLGKVLAVATIVSVPWVITFLGLLL
jgi:hypothetical protein